ncbi:MAG: Rpn family recombination-promoting nuclease/putative transposase [Candidatus Aminicenantes bacterium]|nr:Rpn family recombination-promoting nuclease/putative transposase [Candidatus Aminicenantes bacterium]
MESEQKKETGERIASPHDKAIKKFLSEKETAKSYFLEYLPAEITKDMDFSTLKISKDSFVDKKMTDYYSDLLYEVKLKNMRAFVYLLIEHKSWADHFTAFQLLKYMVRIWELYLKQDKKAKTLPLILPIVIYHGPPKWSKDTNFISLFDDKTPGYVKDYIPDFCYTLHDISHLPDEEIKGDVLLRILFKTLKYIYTPELRHRLPEILQLFHDLTDKKKGAEYLGVLLRYLTGSARNLTEEDLEESVTKIIEGGDLMSTIAEKWVQKGREQGRKEGIEKGIEKGRKEGREETRREMAKRLIQKAIDLNIIADATGLSRREIDSLALNP